MACLNLPKLFTVGVLSLGFTSAALAESTAGDPREPWNPQAYVIDDFDGNGISTAQYMFGHSWEYDYENTTVQNPIDENSGYSIAVFDDGSGSNNILGFYGLQGEAGYSLGIRVPNLEGCQVISYRYKGATHVFKLSMNGNPTNDDHHFHLEGDSDDWTTVMFKTASMKQVGWGTSADLRLDQVYEVLWQYQPQDSYIGYYSEHDYLYIDDVQCVNPTTYTVNFYVGEDLVHSELFLEGEWPYNNSFDWGDYEEQLTSEQYRVSISGWTPRFTQVAADADYHAVLDTSLRDYDISFRDAYGDYIYGTSLPYGTTPVYERATPTKEPSNYYTYTFKGWGKLTDCDCEGYDESNGCIFYSWDTWSYCRAEETGLLPVTENVSYYPVFTSTIRTYSVTFVDYNGNTISVAQYPYETSADDIVKPSDPSRPSANGVDFQFVGWKPDVGDVWGDAVYIADYTASNGEYTVTFMDGTTVLQSGLYAAGETPVYGGATPTKDSTERYVYTFEDWYNSTSYGYGITDVEENTLYLPVFRVDDRKYWIVFVDDDGTVLDSIQFRYEDEPFYYGRTKGDNSDDYRFYSWNPEIQPVTGRAVYTAVYGYRVRFVEENGEELDSDFYMAGGIPRYWGNLRKQTDGLYTYEFIGWDKEFTAVTGPDVYTALFAAEPIPPSPLLAVPENGSLVLDDFEDGNEQNNLGTEWLAYKDSKGSSVMQEVVSEDGSNNKFLRVEYSQVGWVGTNISLSSDGAVDLSQCNAIQYDYRGGEHEFRIESPFDVEDEHNYKRQYYSNDWTTAIVYWNELENAWGAAPVSAVKRHSTKFVWQLMGENETFEIDNVLCLNKPSYIVKFYDESGTVLLDSALFAEGEMPVYNGRVDLDSIANSRDDDAAWYNVGWSPQLAAVTENTSYRLSLVPSPRTYNVWFCFDDYGNDCDYEEYEYGETPVYEKAVERDPDETCNQYAFNDRWRHYDSDIGETVYGLSPVTDYVTYYAEFACVSRVQYTVTYLDDDGTVLFEKEYYPGSYVDYFNVQKPATDKYEFYFTGWDPEEYSIEGPTTYTAVYDTITRQYPVQFIDYNGDYLEVEGETFIYYDYGTLLSDILTPDEPTRESENGVDYTFAGWSVALDGQNSVTGPVTIVATYESSENKYTVVFKDGEDILYSDEYAEGEVPACVGCNPQPPMGDPEYSYSWDATDGWDKPIEPVTGPAVYNAKFTKTPKVYEVVFKNDDGTELYRNSYAYGSTIDDAPSISDVVDGKTGQFEYFGDWCLEYTSFEYDKDLDDWVEEVHVACDGLRRVTENATYIARVLYRVAFENGDGSLIDETWRRYGESLQDAVELIENNYDDGIIKPSTAQYDYVWNGGWNNPVVNVAGSVVYTATYDSTLRQYEVAFADEDGSLLKAGQMYDYGTVASSVETPAETPTKASTVSETFAFAGWSVVTVTKDTVYRAQFNASPRMYVVAFVDEDGSTPISSGEYAYGTPAGSIVVPTAPTKTNRRFVGWNTDIADVTGAATYVAHYVDNATFVVTWRNADGTVLDEQDYASGVTPVYGGEPPTMPSTDEFDYEFVGWNSDVVAVTQDVEYTATYRNVRRIYQVQFVNYDGTVLQEDNYEYGTAAADIVVPEVPPRSPTESYEYTFIGWNPAVQAVTGNATYTARYANKVRVYTVTFVDADGDVWDSETYNYGDWAYVPDYGPDKVTLTCLYEFVGWESEYSDNVVVSDRVYTAEVSSECQALNSQSYGAVTVIDYGGYKIAYIDGEYTGSDEVRIEENIKVDGVALDRSFTVGKFSTIVLPFSISLSDVDGADFYTITGFNKVGETWKQAVAQKVPVTGTLEANRPYLLNPTSTQLSFSGRVTLKTSDNHSSTFGEWEFRGTYNYVAFGDSSKLLGRAYGFAGVESNGYKVGEFARAGSGAWIPAMRAYLVYNDGGSAGKSAVDGSGSLAELPETLDVILVDEKGATIGGGSFSTVTGQFRMDRWYDLQGRKLKGKPTTKGTYYHNGKMVIVK